MALFNESGYQIDRTVRKVKGKTEIQVFQKFSYLRTKKYWGNHFWAAGYCDDTVGMDAEMIKNMSNIKIRNNINKERVRYGLVYFSKALWVLLITAF